MDSGMAEYPNDRSESFESKHLASWQDGYPNSEAALSSPLQRIGIWIHVIWQHPYFFWIGAWMALLMISGIALTMLMNPDLSKPPLPLKQPLPNEPSTPQADSGTLPLWSLGAIAASCAVGCFAISQRLKLAQAADFLPDEDEEKEEKTLPTFSSPPLVPLTPSHPPSLPEGFPAEIEPSLLTNPASEEVPPLDWQTILPELGLDELADPAYHQLISAWLRSRHH